MAKIKASKTEYTAAMLPQTRREVFWDVLKMHWRRLLSHGLVILLFSLPLQLFALYEDACRVGMQQALATATGQEQEQIAYEILSLSNTRAALDVLGFLILAVGIAGMVRVIRQYAWEENVHFTYEFFKGIRQNGRQTLVLGLLVGIVQVLTVYAFNLVLVTPSMVTALILMIPVCIVIFLGIPAAGYTLVAISLYENTCMRNLKLGIVMAAKSPGKTLLAMLCCLVPYLVQMVPNLYCHILGGLLGAVMTPAVMLGWYLFTLEGYDRHVNRTLFPDLVGKGTFRPEE